MHAVEARAIGAYLGLAVGDALGATVEFMTPREIVASFGVHRRMRGGGWLKLRPGQVTDDTEMSLALGRAIRARGTVRAEDAAEAFSAWMRGKPVDIGNTVRRGIVRFRRTGEALSPPSEHDAGNGACMRLLPAVLVTLNAPLAVRQQAVLDQARVTHHNAESDAGCLAVAAMLRQAILYGDREAMLCEARRLAEEHPRFRFDRKPETNPSGYIAHTLRAVFQAFEAGGDFEARLVNVVNRGGDADTTGAILGMLAGGLEGFDAIPSRWFRRLDWRVADEVISQARDLIELGVKQVCNTRKTTGVSPNDVALFPC